MIGRNKRGQGSFLGGDIPSIIMIVISITFFLSSLGIALNQFNSNKQTLEMQAALVDAATSFLQQNAKIRPRDLEKSDIWSGVIDKLKTHGVSVYIELSSLDPEAPDCAQSPCKTGSPPDAGIKNVLSKRFPIALVGESDLEVYPALVKVTVYGA